jgi:hypothetical protein
MPVTACFCETWREDEPMKAFALILGMVAVVAALVVTTGCEQRVQAAAPGGSRLAQMHSKMCTVQFRRDALGTAGTVPVSPTTGGINGGQVSVTGKLRSFDDEWLALDTEKQGVLFIPKEVVLLVQVE